MSSMKPLADFFIRPAIASDAVALLALMRELAAFENYLDRFCVTAQDLLERGWGAEQNQFHAQVAVSECGRLLGYAVVVVVPFTFDLRPDWRLKELYVTAQARNSGVGKALMQAVIVDAGRHQCGRLKWDVLPDNENARQFYRRFGAEPVHDWEAWALHF